jgi:hypothetical protein
VPCLKQLAFRIFAYDTYGRTHDLNKEWSGDLEKLRTFKKDKHIAEYHPYYISEMVLFDVFGFKGGHVGSYIFNWTDSSCKEGIITYGQKREWLLKRIL